MAVRWIIFWITLVTLSMSSFDLVGQVFVRLEKYDDPKSIKFGPGSTMYYRTYEEGDRWLKSKISEVDYKKQVIVFVRGYEHLTDITHVKTLNQTTKVLGDKLMQFSIAWFLYGGIATLINDDYSFGWDTAGIGIGAFVTGFVTKKLGGEKIFNVKKRDRLRIVDVSWPEPRG